MNRIRGLWRGGRKAAGPSGPARTLVLVVGLGLSFGFIGTVFAIAWESYFSLPGGVLEQEYATLGRRVAESGRFEFVSSMDFSGIAGAAPEVEWSYGTYGTERAEVVDGAGTAYAVELRRVSANFLSLLGVGPGTGRTAAPGRDAPVAVMAHGTWRRLFGGAAGVDGVVAIVDGDTAVPVVGTADPEFGGVFDRRADVWMLAPVAAPFEPGTVTTNLAMFGVVPAGLTLSALQSLVAGPRLAIPEHRNDRVEVVRGLELHPDARGELRQRLVWLGMVVALLLALAFVGFVDFLAADHAVNAESHAVRLAVGATPIDVFRETAVLHAKYGLGIVAASLASFLYIADRLLGMGPFAQSVGDLGAASSMAGVGASTALLAAAYLWSCWMVGRAVSRRSLVFDRTMSGAVRRSGLAWTTLLFAAAASLLMTLSILLHYARTPAATLGFANLDALMVGVLYPEGPTPEGSRRIRDALSGDAAVAGAARAEMLPLLSESVQAGNRMKATGDPAVEDVVFYRNRVDGAFFDVLGVDLLAGRLLEGPGASEAVLSRTAATRFGADFENVVGTTVELAPEGPGYGDVLAVVGVVEDIPYDRLEEPLRPVVYTALREADATRRFQDLWLIRHRGAAGDVVGLLRELGGGIEETYRVGTPAGILREQFARRSVEAVLAMAGAFAFLLALVGVANSLVRTVADQAGQIRIRHALGATDIDEARRIGWRAVGDLLLAGAVLSAVVLAGRYFAPGLFSVVELLLVPVVLAVLALLCLAGSYASVRHVARSAAVAPRAGR